MKSPQYGSKHFQTLIKRYVLLTYVPLFLVQGYEKIPPASQTDEIRFADIFRRVLTMTILCYSKQDMGRVSFQGPQKLATMYYSSKQAGYSNKRDGYNIIKQQQRERPADPETSMPACLPLTPCKKKQDKTNPTPFSSPMLVCMLALVQTLARSLAFKQTLYIRIV